MEQITAKLPDDTADTLDEIAAEEYDDNRSEAIRSLIQRGIEYDDLREERDRLERQYRQLVEQREEHTELVEYVEHERAVRERREARRTAPAWRRAKWWLLGAPDGASDDVEAKTAD